MTDANSLAERFDYTSPETYHQLVDVYSAMRTRCPVNYSPAHGGAWVISRYEDICDAAKDYETFSSAGGTTFPHVGHPVPALPPESDPPIHTVARGTLMPFLTPAAVKDYEDYVRDIVTRLIDGFIEKGEADLVHDFAEQIPAYVVARLCGFSAEDGTNVHRWMKQMAEGAGTGNLELLQAAATSYFSFLQKVVDENRADPKDDLIGAILTAEFEGRRFTTDECVGILYTTTAGAIDTTVDGISHALRLLCVHPDVRKRLIDDPALSIRAVQEVLRLDAPAQILARTVNKDTVFRGKEMKKGDRVLLVWGSGNHDDDRFSEPETFDLERPRNSHLSFGHGIHQCAGMHLARLEMRIAIEEILARLPDYELVEDVEPIGTGGVSWTLPRLLVRFTPGRVSDSAHEQPT